MISTDTELIEALREDEWGTGIIVREDDTNTEFEIVDVGIAMGGCEHTVIYIKRIPEEQNFFRTPEQQIKEHETDIKGLEELLNRQGMTTKQKELISKVIEQKESTIEALKKHQKNETTE